MIAHTTLPAAAIDITCRAALDIDGGTGGQPWSAKPVAHRSARASGIDVLDDGTAQQGYVGSAIDITAVGFVRVAPSAAIGIVHHGGSLMDDDIGIVLIGLVGPFVNLSLAHLTAVGEVCQGIGDVIIIMVIIPCQIPCILRNA